MTTLTLNWGDSVRILYPNTTMFDEIEGAKYAELFSHSKFLDLVSVKTPTDLTKLRATTDTIACTIVRKIADNEYLGTILITHVATGHFSDEHYVVVTPNIVVSVTPFEPPELTAE